MKNPRPRHPTAPLVLSALALTVALGGVAYSAIPDAAGVIHGCYLNGMSRTLRVIDSTESCNTGETALNWSQQGPEGPPGQPPAFTKTVVSATVPDGHPVEVARLNVPAGRYVVIGKAMAVAEASKKYAKTGGQCLLKVGLAGPNGKLAVEQASDVASATLIPGPSRASATLVTMVANDFDTQNTLAKPEAISLRCEPGAFLSQDVKFNSIRIVAIRVAELPELQTFKMVLPKPVHKVKPVVKKKKK